MIQQGGRNTNEAFPQARSSETRDPFLVPESPSAPEKQYEQESTNEIEHSPEVTVQEERVNTRRFRKPTSQTQAKPVDLSGQAESIRKIETILAQDLQGIYNQLTPEKKQQFKSEGEQAARKINKLMQKSKGKVKEIVAVIVAWLQILPGVSYFFIRQQAKQKAKKIISTK